jgi:ribonuclease E
VIDFIDMESTANQRAVEDMLRDAVKMDRARIQLGRLSRFGLLELSRQRLRPALSETTHINCPRCSGMGTIRSVESMSLALLRLIGEEARKERTGRVTAQVPVDVATYLMNEKREQLRQIESRDKLSIIVVPNPHLQTPAYNLKRVRDDEKELPENNTASYQIAEQPTIDDTNIGNRDKKPQTEAPLVPSILPASASPLPPAPLPEPEPAPAPAIAAPQVGVFVRLWRWLFGTGDKTTTAAAEQPAPNAERDRPSPAQRDARRFRSGERDRGRDRDRDRSRDRGDRDRDVRREGTRDARRDGRPRPSAEAGPRRSEAVRADQPPRPETPRPEAPRADNGARSDLAARPEAPSRNGEPVRAEREAGTERGERANGDRAERGDRGERGGRGRRRRGRGRRDGGESTTNGHSTSGGQASGGETDPVDGGRSEAPARQQGAPIDSPAFSAGPAPGPGPSASPSAAPSFAEPARERSAPPPEPARSGSQEKYVVWSSGSSDPARGPEDR